MVNPRTKELRDTYRPGDHLQGRVLTRPRSGLAWIDFHGRPLLARILTPVHVGRMVDFQIISLNPQIVLRQTGPGTPEEGEDMSLLVRSLLGVRSTFEHLVMEHLPSDKLLSEPDLVLRRRLFRRIVQQDPESWSTLVRVREGVARMNTALARKGARRYLYLPWLLPPARESEMVSMPPFSLAASAGESIWRARMGDQPVAAALNIRPPKIFCRLFCDDRHIAGMLARWARGWCFGGRPLELKLLDTLPLDAWTGSEPLALLLDDGTANVNLRV
jgi:hypothetical protein